MEKSIRMGKEKRETLPGAALALAISVVFSLIFYTCNTPLGAAVGSDNAMYLTMGTALAKGFAPYTQILTTRARCCFSCRRCPSCFTMATRRFLSSCRRCCFCGRACWCLRAWLAGWA